MNFTPNTFPIQSFYQKVIEHIQYVYPNSVVVQRNQNHTMPVDILIGEELWVLHIERVQKIGTDYEIGHDDNGVWTWRGDRLVRVNMELFSPDALEKLTAFRDWQETENLNDFLIERNIAEMRQADAPFDSTRVHGHNTFVPSAIYQTEYHAYVEYLDERGLIESGTIYGDVDGRTIDTPYNIVNP